MWIIIVGICREEVLGSVLVKAVEKLLGRMFSYSC
jgi:hypothetical protein